MFLRLKNLLTPERQRVSARQQQFARLIYSLFGNTFTFNDYTQKNVIEQTYMNNDAVYRAVRLLVDACLQLKYKIVRVTPQGEETIPEHPFYDVLNAPNDYQTWADFLALELSFYLVTGNSYTYKVIPNAGVNAGKVIQLHVLPSQLINIVRSENMFQPIKHYEINMTGGLKIETKEVIHRRTVQMDYKSEYGMSPLEPARRVITTSNDVKEAAMRLLQNSGMQGILVAKNTEGLDETSLKNVSEALRANFQGANNYGSFPLVSDPMEWIQIGMKAADMQLALLDKQTEKQIAGLFNIPSILMSYDDTSTYDNLNQSRKQLYTNAAIPQMRRLLDALTRNALWTYGDTSLKLKLVTEFQFL